MELVFVRHALPERVDARPDGGPADPSLAPLGREQAARLARHLAAERLDAVVVSPLARARQTAEPLLAATGLPLAVEPGIAEFDTASGTYVPVEEMRAANDPRWQLLAGGHLYADGLDVREFRERVVEAVEGVVAAYPGGRVALVCHAGVVNGYTAHVLGIERDIWFAPGYASLTRVGAARDGRRGLVSLNETGHVRDLLAGWDPARAADGRLARRDPASRAGGA